MAKLKGKNTEQDELMVANTLLIQHTNPSQYIYTVSVVGKQEWTKHQDYTNADVQLYYRSVPNPVPSTALGSPKSLAVKRQTNLQCKDTNSYNITSDLLYM